MEINDLLEHWCSGIENARLENDSPDKTDSTRLYQVAGMSVRSGISAGEVNFTAGNACPGKGTFGTYYGTTGKEETTGNYGTFSTAGQF